MNEQGVANAITKYLNQSTRQLDRDTLLRLQQARTEALSHHVERKPAFGFAWSGHSGTAVRHGGHPGARLWVPFVILLALLSALGYWHFSDTGSDLGEIDALLLADDLPVSAYLDHRFDAWVRRSEQ
jgi:hypothetical protein